MRYLYLTKISNPYQATSSQTLHHVNGSLWLVDEIKTICEMLTAQDIYINLYNLRSPKQLSFEHGSNGSILISDPHHNLCKHFWLAGSEVLNMGNINILRCPTFVSDLKNNIKFGIIWEDLKKPTLQLICLLKFISCLGLFLISFIM